jgi:hypothetical protein
VTDVSVETPPDRLTTYITPNDDFFVRHHSPKEAPDPGGWSLVVEGEVSRPLRLSLEELKRLPAATVTSCWSARATAVRCNGRRCRASPGGEARWETRARREFACATSWRRRA